MPRASRKGSINAQIGERLKQRRLLAGMSQTALGLRMGLSFQQVQKYETGVNAVSPDRLLTVAGILGVPITYFFDGLEGGASSGASSESVALEWREIRLIQRLRRVPEGIRAAVEKLVASTAEEEAEESRAEPKRAVRAAGRPANTRLRRGAA